MANVDRLSICSSCFAKFLVVMLKFEIASHNSFIK